MPTFQGDIHEDRLSAGACDQRRSGGCSLCIVGPSHEGPSDEPSLPSERELEVAGPTYIDLTEVVDSRVVVRLVLLHPEVAKGLEISACGQDIPRRSR